MVQVTLQMLLCSGAITVEYSSIFMSLDWQIMARNEKVSEIPAKTTKSLP